MASVDCVVLALKVEQLIQHPSRSHVHGAGHGALLVDLDQVQKILIDSTARRVIQLNNNSGPVSLQYRKGYRWSVEDGVVYGQVLYPHSGNYKSPANRPIEPGRP
jgi:hypothetical protein